MKHHFAGAAAQVREITRAVQGSGTVEVVVSLVTARCVPSGEKKVSAADGAAEGRAVLVEADGRTRGGEEVAGVQHVVLQGFEDAAVILCGCRLRVDMVTTPPVEWPNSAE